jgi:serine/threonine protein kinase
MASVALDSTSNALAGKFDLNSKTLAVGDFVLGKTLGTGAFGRVRFVTHKATNNFYALKTLKKASIIKMKQVDHIVSEKNILVTLKHPLIVNMWGSFHDQRYIYMLLEYIVGGEFFTHLRKAGRFDNELSCFYGAQIAAIFEYCHSKNIVYRDLKPENILINADGYVKLTDFGFAKVIEHRTYTLCGTPEYIAPEVLLNKGHGKPVDWWTLGILIYEMIVGYPPFVDEDPMGIYQKILSGKIVFPKMFDKNAKGLVKKLLTADLGKRYGNLKNGVDDIKTHKWFKDINWQELLEKKLPATFKPVVKGESDTSNFDDYPDSDELPPIVNAAQDPFASW